MCFAQKVDESVERVTTSNILSSEQLKGFK